jgi:hypothetical protein
VTIDAACPANLLAAGEIFAERLAHGLEAVADVSLNSSVRDCQRSDPLRGAKIVTATSFADGALCEVK